MKNPVRKLALILITWIFPIVCFTQSPPRFQESGGLAIIEIESAPTYGSWELDTAILGHTGQGYLHYKGSNMYNTPGFSLLTFEIAIETTGRYRFQWHSRIAAGTSQSDHNDSWLRFHDASDFYGEKDGQRVYPKGTGKTPNPNGSSKNGWFKIYQNNLGNWTWATRTSDHDPHEIFVEFDTAGIYTLEISGRSNGHAINRLALYHSDVNASLALDLSRPESERIQNVSIHEIPVKPLTIRPTVASRMINIDLPSTLHAGQYEAQIINTLGQHLQSFSFLVNGNSEIGLPISHLGQGIYVVRFRRDAIMYQGKFMKQ